jgi:hypothetical protein
MKTLSRLAGSITTVFLFIAVLLTDPHVGAAGNVLSSSKDIPIATGGVTIGNSTSVVRTVTGKLEAGKRYLSFQDDIYRDELIETFEGSATELTFLDDSVLTLGPETAVVLDRFVYNPDSDANEFVLSVAKGVLRFATGKLNSDAYEIHTPVSTIGIRGTVIDVTVGTAAGGVDAMTLTVIEGEATLFACGKRHLTVPEGYFSEVIGHEENCFYRVSEAITYRDHPRLP